MRSQEERHPLLNWTTVLVLILGGMITDAIDGVPDIVSAVLVFAGLALLLYLEKGRPLAGDALPPGERADPRVAAARSARLGLLLGGLIGAIAGVGSLAAGDDARIAVGLGLMLGSSAAGALAGAVHGALHHRSVRLAGVLALLVWILGFFVFFALFGAIGG